MKNLWLLLVCLIFFPLFIDAQAQTDRIDEYCGTDFNAKMDARLDRNLNVMRSGFYKRNNAVRYIPITFQLVALDDGTQRYSEIETMNRLCELNAQFSDTDMQFYLADNNGFAYHDNSAWYNGGGFNIMTTITKLPNTINFYVVGEAISPGSGVVVCGFYSQAKDVVVVSEFCYEALNTTAMHELGHFFTLPHTFDGITDAYVCGTTAPAFYEKLDGSNCTSVGDRFCDTGPDYLNIRWTCVGSSGVSGCQHIDANGDAFFPSGRNTMSYSNDQCVNQFSGEQANAMNIDLDNRPDLLTTATIVVDPITVVPVLSEPGDGTTTAFGVLDFRWTPVPNATRYVFQVSTSSSFADADIVVQEFVNAPDITLNNQLDQNTVYHWRVRPFNDANTCAEFTNHFSFATSDFQVGLNEVDGLNSFSLFPNPIVTNQEIGLTIDMEETKEGFLKLFNIQGQLLQSTPLKVTSNQRSYTLDSSDLSNGLYIISLEFKEGTVQEKLIISK